MDAITREEKLMDGQTLEPITRKEKILAGEDLETITREEYFLKKYRGGGGGDITVESLNVTENGTYTAPTGKAYTPVVVAVEGYAKKSISPTPTAIATFNASALPMPSLTVGIEAVQSGTGDPSPTNVRPISGWSAVNVHDVGDNWGDCADIPEPLTANKWYSVNLPYNTCTISFDVVNAVRTALGNTLLFAIYDGTTNTNILADKIYSVEDGSTYLSKGANVSGRFYFTYTGKLKSIGCYWRSNTYQLLTSGALENIMIEVGNNPTKQYIPYNGTTYTTQLKDGQGNPMTCYGGQLTNENGVQRLELTHGHIASYNGETLPSTWISDRDVYAEGTTPTIGAEVVYELATPQQIPQDNLPIASQSGVNNLWADSGDIQSGEYFVEL